MPDDPGAKARALRRVVCWGLAITAVAVAISRWAACPPHPFEALDPGLRRLPGPDPPGAPSLEAIRPEVPRLTAPGSLPPGLAFDFDPSDGPPEPGRLPAAELVAPVTSTSRAFSTGFACLQPLDPGAHPGLSASYLFPLDDDSTLRPPVVECSTWLVQGVLSASGAYYAVDEVWAPADRAPRLVQLHPGLFPLGPSGPGMEDRPFIVARALPGAVPEGVADVPLGPDLSTQEPLGVFLTRFNPGERPGPCWVRHAGGPWVHLPGHAGLPGLVDAESLSDRGSVDLAWDASDHRDRTAPGQELWITVSRWRAEGSWEPILVLPADGPTRGTLTGLLPGSYSLVLLLVESGRLCTAIAEAQAPANEPGTTRSVEFRAGSMSPSARGRVRFAVETPAAVGRVGSAELHRVRAWPLEPCRAADPPPLLSLISQDAGVGVFELEAAVGEYGIEVPYAGIHTTATVQEGESELGTFPYRGATVRLRLLDAASGLELRADRISSNLAAPMQLAFDLEGGVLEAPAGHFSGVIYAEGYVPRAFELELPPGTHEHTLTLAPESARTVEFGGAQGPRLSDLEPIEGVLLYGEDGGLLEAQLLVQSVGPGGVVRALGIDGVDWSAPVRPRWLHLPASERFPFGVIIELERDAAGRLLPIEW